MFCRTGSRKIFKRFFHTVKDEIKFTDAFWKALNKKLTQRPSNQFLKLQISAGEGREFYKQHFKFESKVAETYYVLTQKQQRVVFAIGEEQIGLVGGLHLDYTTQMMKQMLYVKENPKSQISCS